MEDIPQRLLEIVQAVSAPVKVFTSLHQPKLRQASGP